MSLCSTMWLIAEQDDILIVCSFLSFFILIVQIATILSAIIKKPPWPFLFNRWLRTDQLPGDTPILREYQQSA